MHARRNFAVNETWRLTFTSWKIADHGPEGFTGKSRQARGESRGHRSASSRQRRRVRAHTFESLLSVPPQAPSVAFPLPFTTSLLPCPAIRPRANKPRRSPCKPAPTKPNRPYDRRSDIRGARTVTTACITNAEQDGTRLSQGINRLRSWDRSFPTRADVLPISSSSARDSHRTLLVVALHFLTDSVRDTRFTRDDARFKCDEHRHGSPRSLRTAAEEHRNWTARSLCLGGRRRWKAVRAAAVTASAALAAR